MGILKKRFFDRKFKKKIKFANLIDIFRKSCERKLPKFFFIFIQSPRNLLTGSSGKSILKCVYPFSE